MCEQRERAALEALNIDQLTFVLRLILDGWGLNDALLAMDERQQLSGEDDT